MTELQTTDAMRSELAHALACQYGPLLSSRDSWRILGFPSPAAYRQALARQRIAVPLFEIAGRRGRFALTQEVAQWLADQRLGIRNTPIKEV